MFRRALGSAIAFLVILSTGWAQENKTTITAEKLTFDYKRYTAVFEGNVVAVDPQARIEADELRVIFNNTNNVKSVTAIGNVRLFSEDRKATCSKAIYVSETGEVLLTGKAVLIQGKDTVKGDRITFFLQEERAVVEGRTELQLSPKSQPPKLPKK